ncbi:MAG: hypothetical protein M1821_008994 [Bathelium mastoideum]|nr:MAG: hypothetical protein M1821_008994 [Bathelium mastoideum]KAI9684303.1 MAG: hypothetical protein M1822_005776 [Bathelium mastoideum]
MAQSNRALSENIALLAQFPKVQNSPSTNPIPSKFTKPRSGSEVRSLTFEQERRTAEVFAFLLATTDDATAVGAVCIEETSDRRSITVRSAVNSGAQNKRKEAFRKLINAAKISLKSEQERGILLREVVAVSQLRLLARLRSQHAPWSRRAKGPPLIPLLQKALQTRKPKNDEEEDLQTLRKVVDDLVKIFERLEKLPKAKAISKSGVTLLLEIISKVNSELDLRKLAHFISGIPPRDSPWSGTPSEKVVRKFNKLTQYVAAEQHLRYIVRKYPSWNIQEAVGGPYRTHPDGAEPDTAVGLLARSLTTGTANQKKQFRKGLESRLGKDMAKIQNELHTAARSDCRVHAEIQLLFHYEQNPPKTLSPRVLASNKEACYLCNLFIKTHGRYYTPKSHERLYPEWRLPRFDETQVPKKSRPALKETINKFNLAIEGQIRFLLCQPLSRRLDPSESTVLLPGIYTPSHVSASQTPGTPIIQPHLIKSDLQDVDLTSQQLSTQASPVVQLDTSERNETTEPVPAKSEISAKNGPRPTNEPIPIIHRYSPSKSQPHSPLALADNPPSIDNSRIEQFPLPDPEIEDPVVVSSPEEPYLLTETHNLTYGGKVEIKMSPGSSAAIHTTHIHVEFTFEKADSSIASPLLPPDSNVTLTMHWVDKSQTLLEHYDGDCVDLEAPQLETLDGVSCRSIFADSGMIMYRKDQAIVMRVVRDFSVD